MNDYIDMKKLWYDSELAQLKIVCSTEVITASAQIYVTDALIDDLIHQLKHFLNGQVQESYWANEEKGDSSTVCVSLRFQHKDKLGHVSIEVYMELDDGGAYSRHNCCFYLNTEIGLLTKFCEKLPHLKEKVSGIEVVLNEDALL